MTTLSLTQKEFIGRFLSDADGKPTMSIATLSNLECKYGARLNEVILTVSESLGINSVLAGIITDKTYGRLSLKQFSVF